MFNRSPVFQSRGFFSESPLQKPDMTRPSGKSIYKQRKEYTESINTHADSFMYRVEHLLTCEMNGKEVSTADDCVERLKSLESRGKVWGQDMILQVQRGSLQLCDIETKEVLESLPLDSISQTKAVLDSCMYDSLLMITVQDYGRRAPRVFLFQCEDTGAEEVRADLNRTVQNKEQGFQPSEPPFDIRSNLDNIIGQNHPASFNRPGPTPLRSSPTIPEPSAFQDYDARPPMFLPRDDYNPDMEEHPNQRRSPPYTETERSVEIFNHVIGDIEIFMEKVGSAIPQENENRKKKKKGKSQMAYGQMHLPSVDEYAACLQKIKYAFNLLGKIERHLTKPAAPEFVHILFSSLNFLVKQYPPEVPHSVLSPLLTEPALQLLGQVVTPEEDQLWNYLGDAWNITRSRWKNGDQIPPYIPHFYDGWEPPPPVSSPPSSQNHSLSRSNSQRFSDRTDMHPPHIQDNRLGGSLQSRSGELPKPMRVSYDFTARNRQELSVMKGDVVQVVDNSKQWWTVRNNRGQEGHVPPNILEPMDREEPARMSRPPNLDMRSSPEEVRAWLQQKGFSKQTVHSLGMMNGALLLGLKRDELRALCPEDGGRLFFQLQGVRSSMALGSEADTNNYGGW